MPTSYTLAERLLGPAISQEAPRRAGAEQVVFSTATALVPDPQVCFDVNGYYRELGVHWRAGKTDLRRAYLARDGARSERLTYVLVRLLDPATRRRYDRTALGSLFLDRYVLAAVIRRLLHQAGTDVDLLRRLADTLGFDLTDPLDPAAFEADDGPAPPEYRDDDPEGVHAYGYYLWRSPGHDRPGALADWRDMLIRAASKRGLVAQIAVGVVGSTPLTWVHARVGYRDVMFINERVDPTESLAQTAIDSLPHP